MVDASTRTGPRPGQRVELCAALRLLVADKYPPGFVGELRQHDRGRLLASAALEAHGPVGLVGGPEVEVDAVRRPGVLHRRPLLVRPVLVVADGQVRGGPRQQRRPADLCAEVGAGGVVHIDLGKRGQREWRDGNGAVEEKTT